MNGIVFACQIKQQLKSVGLANIPTVTAVVSSILGNNITLTTTPSGTVGAFDGGVIRFTSGVYEGLGTAILVSNGPVITTAISSIGRYAPAPGDTVELSGGPLAQATLFLMEPFSVKGADITGKEFFVTVNPTGDHLTLERMVKYPGLNPLNWFSSSRTYDFEVVLEAPYNIGDPTNTVTVTNAIFDLHLLKEQVQIQLASMRLDSKNRIYAASDITSTFGMIQRTGQSTSKKSCIVELSISTR